MHVVKEICHRVAVMEKGKVIEEGKLFDVFTQPKQRRLKTLYVLLLMIIYQKVF